MKDANTDTANLKFSSRNALKTSVAGGFGVILELYDFLVYGFISSTFAVLFFPSHDFLISLILTFTTFAIGFAARPIGGIVFGHLGDKIGRRYTLIFTIGLMGAASLFTGLLPTYAQVGVLAPILLTILRLVQGFAVGGEYGGAMTLTAEASPPKSRGLFVSVAQMSNIGPLFALGMALSMESITGANFIVYGWRIMYFIGVAVAIVGLLVRLKVRESLVFQNMVKNRTKPESSPLHDTLVNHWKLVLIGLGFIISATIADYIGSTFMLSYLRLFKIPETTVIYTLMGGLAVGFVINIVAGAASDRIGRRPIMIAGAVILIVFVFPYFYLLSTGNAVLMFIAQSIYYGAVALQTGPSVTMLTEFFPTEVRYTGMSLDYQVAASVFGGTAPLFGTLLIYTTHYNLAPAFLVLAGTIVTIIAFIIPKETAKTSIEEHEFPGVIGSEE